MSKKRTFTNNDINKMNRTERQEFWEAMQSAFGENPKKVDGQFTARTAYYRSQLLNIVKGRIKIKCPDWWDKDYMLELLLLKGRFFIADSPIGVAPFDGSPYGFNVFRRNSRVTIVNEILGEFDRSLTDVKSNETDENRRAVVVYLYDNKHYRSINEMLNIYSAKLAMCDASIDVNLFNCKTPFVFNVSDSKQAETAKALYDKISLGEPAVFTRMKNPMSQDDGGVEVLTLPVKDNFMGDKMQELKRAIIGEFLTSVGLNNTAYEKRERLITSEADSNNEEIESNVTYIKQNFKTVSKEVRKVFGIDFKIKVRGSGKDEKDKIQSNIYETADT